MWLSTVYLENPLLLHCTRVTLRAGLLLRPSFEKLSVRETLGITVDQFLFLPYFAILLILRVIDQT
jgi:hypothetical protein